MSYQKKAYESSLKAHKKLIATKLLDGIEKLYENKASERRWIWELLQNAKDVADISVKVEIILDKNYVEFRHNGNPFLMDNITYLIEQVSTKDRSTSAEEVLTTTGKFGTGFMTTHLLSKKVAVSGILEDRETEKPIYKRFNLQLDRGAKTPDEMITKVDKSFEVFEELDDENLCPILRDYHPNQDFDTSFKYELDQEGLTIAEIGINDLHNALSYTLVFLPKIASVKVKDHVHNTEINYVRVNEEKLGIVKISTIEISNNNLIEVVKIATISNEKNTLCLAISLEELEEKLSIKRISKHTPILFCDFPLIGSEKFTFPVVLNSPVFNPTEPRDGVLLDDREEEKRLFNKQIFEETITLYQQLLEYASLHWKNAYLLANSGIPQEIDQNWYQLKVQKVMRQLLLNTPIVDTANQTRISLKNALIPYHRTSGKISQLWELALILYPDQLPQKEHLLDWYNFIDSDWKKDFGIQLRYDLDNLIQHISRQENINQLGQRLKRDQVDVFVWLNRVLAFVFEDKSNNLVDNYPIIPNQYGNFKRWIELYKDENLSEDLKYVLKVLGEDWKTRLAHLQINCKFADKLDTQHISETINNIIRDGKVTEIRKAVYYLISCFPNEVNEIRENIYKFAKDLDQFVPEKRYIERTTNKLWQEGDRWLLKTLIADIVKLGNVVSLQISLNRVTLQDAIHWLSDFMAFLNTNDEWQLFYTRKHIFPNQEGLFKDANEINLDGDIPEEIKDILEKLGLNYRKKLLDRNFKSFNVHQNTLTVINASDGINKIIDESANNPLIGDSLIIAIYDLISYFATNSPEEKESDRYKIWKFAQTIYGEKIPSQITILPQLKDFKWDKCNQFILQEILDEIANQQTLNSLSQRLNLSLTDSIIYLDQLIYFSYGYTGLKYVVIETAVFPNQNGILCEKKYLKKDGDIPEELKEIAEYLTKKSWSEELLLKHENFTETPKIFEERDTESIENIAKEIDEALKNYNGNPKDYNFVHPVKLLFTWSSNETKEYISKLFPYFAERKPHLLLDIIGDDHINESIFQLIQTDPDKLNLFAKLANNPDISLEDLKNFLENSSDLRILEGLKQKDSSPRDIVNHLAELGIDMELLKQELNNQDQETINISYNYKRENNVTRNYPNVITFDDINNEEPNIGELGEQFVYDKLVIKFGVNRVQWMNQEKEGRQPYDFKVLEENLQDIAYYIDAKSTQQGEYQSDSTLFSITNAQWEFMKKCDNYYIARVFRVGTEKPDLKLLKINLDDELLK